MKIAILTLIAACEATTLASYESFADMEKVAAIDLDVKEMSSLMNSGNFSYAKWIYEFGKNAEVTAGGYEIIQKFSTEIQSKAADLITEDLLLEYLTFTSYYGNNELYADLFVQNALTGEGEFKGLSNSARKQLGVKGVQYQVFLMFVLRELYEAIKFCVRNQGPRTAEWDEGAALYIGSQVNVDGVGFLQYSLPEKRKGSFGINANERAMAALTKGQEHIKNNECSQATGQLYEIRKSMQIALLQGTVEYSFKSDLTYTSSPSDAARAEVWAFAAGVLPFVHDVDKSAASIIRSNVEYSYRNANLSSTTNSEAVASAVYKILPKLCISCEEFGTLSGLNTVCENNQAQLDLSCDALQLNADQTVTNGSSGLSGGAITGIVVCGVAIVVIMIGVAFFMMKAPPANTSPSLKPEENTEEIAEDESTVSQV